MQYLGVAGNIAPSDEYLEHQYNYGYYKIIYVSRRKKFTKY